MRRAFGLTSQSWPLRLQRGRAALQPFAHPSRRRSLASGGERQYRPQLVYVVNADATQRQQQIARIHSAAGRVAFRLNGREHEAKGRLLSQRAKTGTPNGRRDKHFPFQKDAEIRNDASPMRGDGVRHCSHLRRQIGLRHRNAGGPAGGVGGADVDGDGGTFAGHVFLAGAQRLLRFAGDDADPAARLPIEAGKASNATMFNVGGFRHQQARPHHGKRQFNVEDFS